MKAINWAGWLAKIFFAIAFIFMPTSRTTQSKSKARLTSSHLLLSHQTSRNPSQAFVEELPVPEVFQMDFEDTGSQDLNYEWEHQG